MAKDKKGTETETIGANGEDKEPGGVKRSTTPSDFWVFSSITVGVPVHGNATKMENTDVLRPLADGLKSTQEAQKWIKDHAADYPQAVFVIGNMRPPITAHVEEFVKVTLSCDRDA